MRPGGPRAKTTIKRERTHVLGNFGRPRRALERPGQPPTTGRHADCGPRRIGTHSAMECDGGGSH
eukprot:4601317-Alexandrium_andersonii.AAC.1